jgi:hypothetical protein
MYSTGAVSNLRYQPLKGADNMGVWYYFVTSTIPAGNMLLREPLDGAPDSAKATSRSRRSSLDLERAKAEENALRAGSAATSPGP